MRLTFICSILSISLAYADADLAYNSSLTSTCEDFFKLKKPNDFKVNVTHKEMKDTDKFSKNTIEVLIKRSPSEAWKRYMNLNLQEMLKTNESEVCSVIDKKGSASQKLIEKNKIFVNMNFKLPFRKDILKSMTAMEVTKVDHKNKTVILTYLEGTQSRGWQVISLVPYKENTLLIHHAYYLGNSELIHNLYPSVHKNVWKGIHANAKASLETLK